MGTDAPASPDVQARDDASRHHELARAVASEAGSRLRHAVEGFRDVLVGLLKADARLLIVAAHALGVHGVPRATVDLDVWIDASPGNVRQKWLALALFGAPQEVLAISEADLAKPDVVVQFGLPPYRIDILTSVSGVTFEEAWEERVEDLFGELRVPFVGRAAFIRNKCASGRAKDLGDLESLGEA